MNSPRSSTSTPTSPASSGCSGPASVWTAVDAQSVRRRASHAVRDSRGRARDAHAAAHRHDPEGADPGRRPAVRRSSARLAGGARRHRRRVVRRLPRRRDPRACRATARATGCASASSTRASDLRGTAGALRLALDEGALEESFLVTYGDSFLPIDFAAVFRAFTACGKPALMTVFRNDGRWDTSNVIFDGRMVTLYDKQRQRRARPRTSRSSTTASARWRGG